MGKLKPKYLFASAALLILLVVVVYVVTRSKDPKDPIPNSPWPGNDVPSEEELMARLQRLREVSDDPSVQRTLDFGSSGTPESLDIRPVTAQQATPPFLLSPEVAPEQPMLEDVVDNYNVMALVGERVEHINKVLNGRIDDVIDVLGDGLQKVNQSVEYCHDRVWRIEDLLKGETAEIDQLLGEIGDDNLIEY